MKLQKLEFYDRKSGWRLNPIDFSDQVLILLVGVSGVGKTQILRAIMSLGEIANGSSLNGIEWSVSFETTDKSIYCWEGAFESKDETEEILGDDTSDEEFAIEYERVFLNNELIIERDKENIILKGVPTPKLSPFQSVVEMLSYESLLSPIKAEFKKLFYDDQSKISNEGYGIPAATYDKFLSEHNSLESIREDSLPIALKLALVYQNQPTVFNEIKEQFIEIFPHVEDIKIEPVQEVNPRFYGFMFPIQIKERGVDIWIHQRRISSGMRRSLLHLSQLYLLPADSVVLIDEFENSLGVNCIDSLTRNLLQKGRGLQFIITSHHPYIINNIGTEHWKIVVRKGGVVNVIDAKEFKLGKTKHSAFIELIQLEQYTDGISLD